MFAALDVEFQNIYTLEVLMGSSIGTSIKRGKSKLKLQGQVWFGAGRCRKGMMLDRNAIRDDTSLFLSSSHFHLSSY